MTLSKKHTIKLP